ncbi:MAG: Na/Pi cotransporter family protein, partial [Bacteroidaceae bacterium]|nr:Na/Pi cotransporter family protein [Bacteroidaceae bacterium]
GIWSTLLFLLLGGILTMAVQSSAAVMAITMMLCSQGVLPIYQGIALVMGENIGTTITSNIAAMTGNSQARSAALAHLVFNVFGVIWVLCIFKFFVNTVCSLVGYDAEVASTDIAYAQENAHLLNYVLPAFHTAFNVCNVLILIWFIKPIETFVKRAFSAKGDEDEDFRLKFITGGILSTAELSIMEARKELNHYAERTQRMFGLVQELLHTEGIKDFAKLYARIEKYEGISDNMELEIANYLNNVSDGRLSSETKLKIRAMLREVSEIESIGDSCYKIAVSLNHKRQNQPKEDFTADQYRHIEQIMKMSDEALTAMSQVLKANTETNVMASFNKENELNAFRDRLKNLNLEDIDNGLYSYQTGIYYMDIVNECEKLGDYVINVVEARADKKEKKQ